MSSVRDRVKLAEARAGADSPSSHGHGAARRGHILSLKTDEHIKEESLRRSDGGWHKNINVQQQIVPDPVLPPVIKLTSETPIVTHSNKPLPGKLGKQIPGAFVSVAEESSTPPACKDNDDWERVAAMEAAQQAAMQAEANQAENAEVVDDWDRVARLEAEQHAAMQAEMTGSRRRATSKTDSRRDGLYRRKTSRNGSITDDGVLRDIPTARFECLLSQEPKRKALTSSVKNKIKRPSEARHARVSDEDVEDHATSAVEEVEASTREQVLFDPIEYAQKRQARQERKAARNEARQERLAVHEAISEKSRARSPSIRLIRINYDGEGDHEGSAARNKSKSRHRSRSRSAHKHEHEHISRTETSPPPIERRSNISLWPSFSTTHRRSMSDVHGHEAQKRSSHSRHHSEDRSVAGSAHSAVSARKLEFAEYVAGKKLDHTVLVPPKSLPRPMGFVRSHSHTGEYSEGFTREKSLLRKPSKEDVVDDRYDDLETKRNDGERYRAERKKQEPWQMRIMQEVLRH